MEEFKLPDSMINRWLEEYEAKALLKQRYLDNAERYRAKGDEERADREEEFARFTGEFREGMRQALYIFGYVIAYRNGRCEVIQRHRKEKR